MTPKNNRLFGSLTLKLVILGLTVIGLGLAGCSDDSPTNVPAGGNDPATGVFRVAMEDEVDFEIISTKNGDPENPIEGPFAIRGRNIRYDSDMGSLIVDLSVKNLGENTFDEVITLTFLSLLPEGVTVLNPDNNENGPGAAIEFEFENNDGQWTPGEESLPRETHFDVDEGASIGFIARLDTGTGGDAMGSIGGMVWNDANGDGIMDEDESFVEGAMLELTAEGMEAMNTETAADGTYSFNDLPSGFYRVAKMPSEGMVPTTPTMIYVVLVLEDGEVISFLAANFGCQEDSGGGGTAAIKGQVWNDMNGNGLVDDGEPGVEGITVNLSGDATATTTTMADGNYAFNELTTGTYEVVSVGPDGWVLTTDSPIQVILEADDAIFNDASFGWMEEVAGDTGVISGVVFNDLNGNAVKDEDEPGVEGIPVDLSGTATATTTSAADGTYAFNELAIGDYEVTSTGPDGWVPTTGPVLTIKIETAGQVVDDAHLGWMEEAGDTGSISGVVFNDLNGNSVQDEDEPGIEGINVTLDGTAINMTTSAADGSYSFTELGLGEYKVRSAGPEGWSPTTGPELTIKIETVGQVVDDAHLGWMEDVPR